MRRVTAILFMTLLSLGACGPAWNGGKDSPSLEAPTSNTERASAARADCLGRQGPAGLRPGDTFPALQYPNAEWEPVNIKELCGSKAILVVSATEWCGSCLMEFDYLAGIASEWDTRGVRIYYTLFEDMSRQPASRHAIRRLEDYMFEIYGSTSFRVLADSTASLPRSLGGGLSLPVAWLLDEEMVVTNFSEGTNAPMVAEWVEAALR